MIKSKSDFQATQVACIPRVIIAQAHAQSQQEATLSKIHRSRLFQSGDLFLRILRGLKNQNLKEISKLRKEPSRKKNYFRGQDLSI